MYLGRFGRLTDLINAQSGYIRVHDAHLLRRNGDPTTLVLPGADDRQGRDLVHRPGGPEAPAEASGIAGAGGMSDFGEVDPDAQAPPVRAVHAGPHRHGLGPCLWRDGPRGLRRTDDPRFIPLTDVTTRSLADRRIISHYKFVLINRTQMIAASETGRQGDIAAEDVPDL